jgi:putative hydrolase of the HAD superfamily
MQAVLIDLDETLYQPGSGLIRTVDRRITAFIAIHADLPWARADALRTELWRSFGTTARGLNFRHDIDERAVYRFAVDSVDPSAHVSRDPALDEALSRVGAPCYVFTNATRRYAERVLEALGVAHHFHGIFAIEFADFHPKPSPHFYRKVVDELGVPPPEIVLAEDNPGNIGPALEMGMVCVQVGGEDPPPGVLRAASPHQLPDVLEALRERGAGTGRGSSTGR